MAEKWPMDPEAERPRNYTEGVSSDVTWDNFGMRIKWTEPIVPGDFRLPLCEPLKLRLCVETKKELQVPPGDLTAWCWTCMKFKENPYGIWKEIKLHYNPKCTQWDDHGVTSYVFQNFVLPTSDENYRMTFNVKWKDIMIWANFFQIDNILNVEQKPSVGTQTIIYPTVHFTCNFGDNGDKPCSRKSSSPVQNDPSGVQSPQRPNEYSDLCETQREGYTTANEEDMQMLVML